KGIETIVDVGGGNGTTVRLLVKACPWIRGINFDLPHVVSLAPECDRIENVGGDFFDRIPNADAAIIMGANGGNARHLCAWGNDAANEVLTEARLLLVENYFQTPSRAWVQPYALENFWKGQLFG
ncbi:hypothetical protein DVH24_034604, partial [Malus domestica]